LKSYQAALLAAFPQSSQLLFSAPFLQEIHGFWHGWGTACR